MIIDSPTKSIDSRVLLRLTYAKAIEAAHAAKGLKQMLHTVEIPIRDQRSILFQPRRPMSFIRAAQYHCDLVQGRDEFGCLI